MLNLFDKTEEEILNLIKEQSEIGDDLLVVGRFVNYKGKENFINIRNKNFVPLTYVGQGNEHIGQKIKIEIREKHSYSLEKEWYEFRIKLGEVGLRRFLNNPTLITIDLTYEPKVFQPREKEFVLNLYNRKSNQSLETDRGNIQSLRIIEREINRVKEAFIYELLQNADDYSLANKKVDVKIFTTPNEFIFSHNGSPFKFNNVYALCNINDGDKQDDADKIGYKGIGFKSVFAYSEKVLIKSGKYAFKFDKKHPKFQREKPFQIIPIWIDNISQLRDLPINENVNIVIDAKQGKSQIEEWKDLLNDLFSQESSTPVILFLRNIRNVFIDKTLVSQTTREWWIREYKLKLSEDIKSEIKRHFETNTGNIPEKLVGVDEIEIQFSLKHLDYEIIPLPEAILYNYLPTKVNLGFTFLVNSDFIPTGDRHYLFENEWNRYLMKEVGSKFFDWLNTLFTVKHKTTEQAIFKKDYLKLLPNLSKNIEELKSKTSNNLFLLEAFKQGFDLSLTGTETIPAIPFIPTQNGTLETLANILIDETGLANLLEEQFSTLTGINGKLIHNEVGEGEENVKALIAEYQKGTIYGIENLKATLKTEIVQEWLKTPINNFKLIQHLSSKKELQNLLETEIIILSESKQLCKASSLFKSTPNEITFIATEKINSELSVLLNKNKIAVSVTEFEPIEFYTKNILGKHIIINGLLKDEATILNFWKFVYDNWILFEKDKAINESIKQFDVLCKTNEGFSKKLVSSVYLSVEFNPTNEIESVIRSLNIPDAVFISNKYIDDDRNSEQWRKIFKQATAITDLQKVIEILITKLPAMEDSKHFDIAKQIFKFWKDNKDTANKLTDSQIVLVKANLKIKCSDIVFRKSTECFLSDHYNNNQLIASWLPNIELENQITPEYAPRTNQVAEWKIFFALIGCVELTDKQNVFDAKLESFIKHQDNFQDKHFEILKSISDLHKAKKENGLSFTFENTLSKIKLLTSNEEWHLPTNIHLSNEYKPKLLLQQDEKIGSTLLFLNANYFQKLIEKYFLIDIGVNANFQFFTSELKRNEIPADYRQEFEKKSTYIVQNSQLYASQHRLHNHIDLNYRYLLIEFKYAEIFWIEAQKPNSKFIQFLFQETIYKMAFNTNVSFENFVVNFIKKNKTFPNQSNDLKMPIELFSFSLSEYIIDKNELPKYDLREIYCNNDQTKSLEDILGLQKLLSQEHCISLLSRSENTITPEQITNLQIVKILSGYKPTDEEKTKLFLLNINLEWKPISKLFISKDADFPIEPSQSLHEDFYSISGVFGIQELSTEKLVLKTKPQTPTLTDEIVLFLNNKAKFIAFKIDHLNYEVIESDIKEKISALEFYEVTSITKVFPEDNPIYKSEEFDFHFNDDENKILYKGNWRTNISVISFLFEKLQHDKIEKLWFDNAINRWDDDKIIEKLNEEVGTTPTEWDSSPQSENSDGTSNQEKTDTFWTNLNIADENFIRGIIKGDYELNEKLDANTTAKIKTLMQIRDIYESIEVSDDGRFLKADSDEILVRSAQRGLLRLDLYSWDRLGVANVNLSLYTDSCITIFKTQEDLLAFTKPQNKFGILRMPDDYNIDDFNSLENINDKGKWHFVFIVNENTKAAQNYKEFINLDDYNF